MARRNRNKKQPKRQNFQRRYKVVCAGCGKEVMMEVPPPADKNLLCVDCYKK